MNISVDRKEMDEGIVNVSRTYLEFAVRLITIERQIQLVRSKGRTRDGDFSGLETNQFTVIPSVIVYISGKSFEKKLMGLSYIFRKSEVEACPG